MYNFHPGTGSFSSDAEEQTPPLPSTLLVESGAHADDARQI